MRLDRIFLRHTNTLAIFSLSIPIWLYIVDMVDILPRDG